MSPIGPLTSKASSKFCIDIVGDVICMSPLSIRPTIGVFQDLSARFAVVDERVVHGDLIALPGVFVESHDVWLGVRWSHAIIDFAGRPGYRGRPFAVQTALHAKLEQTKG